MRRIPLVVGIALLVAPVADGGTSATDAGRPGPAPTVVDAGTPEGRRTWPVSELLVAAALPPGQDLSVRELFRDAASSHHVVTIADRETPHRHDVHDLVVVILRGEGRMRMGDEERPVGEGSVLYVPRGTVHAFRNTSEGPAVAYAVYTPAFDGKDRVGVE